MQISRRDALATGAAVAVTGLTVAPLAMKAAGVKAALAGSDPQIEALMGRLQAANALYDDNCARYDAATAHIPDYPREIGVSQATMDTYNRKYEASGGKVLSEQGGAILRRITNIEVQIIQTPAKTLHGALCKARVVWHIMAESEGLDEKDPDLDGQYGRLEDPVFIWSMLQDLERLAGPVRS